jgi:hypothetical protein
LWGLRPYERSRCAEHEEVEANALGWVVPAPPGVVMVAPLRVPRKAEGAQCEGRAKEVEKRAAKGSIKAGTPY